MTTTPTVSVKDTYAATTTPAQEPTGQNVGAGLLAIVMVAILNGSSQTVSSVTDTAGNTYTSRGAQSNGTSARIEVWASDNITGNAANKVTVNMSAAANIAVSVVYVTGQVAAHGISVVGVGNTGSVSPGSAIVVTTGNSTLCLMACAVGAANAQAASGDSLVQQKTGTGVGVGTFSANVATPQSKTLSCTFTSVAWAAIAFSVQPPVTGPGAATSPQAVATVIASSKASGAGTPLHAVATVIASSKAPGAGTLHAAASVIASSKASGSGTLLHAAASVVASSKASGSATSPQARAVAIASEVAAITVTAIQARASALAGGIGKGAAKMTAKAFGVANFRQPAFPTRVRFSQGRTVTSRRTRFLP